MSNDNESEYCKLKHLELYDEIPSPLRRKAKIYCKKLPEDFFINSKAIILETNNHRVENRSAVFTKD